MAKRSLQASAEGILKAKRAFQRKGWTQEYLASAAGVESRQPIWKFFTGRPVDRHVFIEICFALDLTAEEIALPPEVDASAEIDDLVQKVRRERAPLIQHQCGTLRMLDISRPVELDEIYVDVNVTEEISNLRWLDIAEFQQGEFDSVGTSRGYSERIGGLEAVEKYSFVVVLGKPGAGKSTFLQAIALLGNRGEFLSNKVPMFIKLKNFAEDARDEGNFSLDYHIKRELSTCGISDQEVEQLLDSGRVLLLLDGLDEVPQEEQAEVIKQIRKFTERYYQNNIIISCRPAAYKYRFPDFTEIEIADFTREQIAAFVQRWFVTVAKPSPEAALTTQFMEQLQLPENWQIRELAGTPILLNLTCLVFYYQGNFPVLRAKLYQQGLDILLVRWDESRGIERYDVYGNLPLPRKLKLLYQLAAKTFKRGEYFFEQSKIEQYIAEYLRTLPDAATEPEILQRESEQVLKSSERQHGILVEQARGIYSFSHLTFQEYLTSREIVNYPEKLKQLVEQISEPRWREVFLLAAEMLPSADKFLELIREKIQALVSGSQKLQQFLEWVGQKSRTYPLPQAAVRAFFFTLTRERVWIENQPDCRGVVLACALVRDLNLDLDLSRILTACGQLDVDMAQLKARSLVADADLTGMVKMAEGHRRVLEITLVRDLQAIAELALDPKLEQALVQLQGKLPDIPTPEWWEVAGDSWISELRQVMKSGRNIGHNWQFSDREQLLLQQFYDANRLLIDCLKSAAVVTDGLGESIEQTWLLP